MANDGTPVRPSEGNVTAKEGQNGGSSSVDGSVGEASANPAVAEWQEKVVPSYKVYSQRWIVLLLFCLYSGSNSFQWVMYAIVTGRIESFYSVSTQAVAFTSLVYMICYIPLIIPASWLLDRYGLRCAVLIGSCGNVIGATIKCFSAQQNLYAVLMVGQTISAASQIFILNIPSRLAAVWFGPKEVSTSCSIGVLGNQLGVAMGFLIPPIVVSAAASNFEAIGSQLLALNIATACTAFVVFLLILIFFRDHPPMPPSPTQAQLVAVESEQNYFQEMRKLWKNLSFVLLFVSYGINTGCYYAIGTLLSVIVTGYFGEDMSEDAGRIGLTIVVSGLLGSVACGFALDRTKAFKTTTLLVYLLSLLFLIGFCFVLFLGPGPIWVTYLTAFGLGFFMTGYLPVGFEFAVELTYPAAEGTSSGLLNASSQFFGIILTLLLETMQTRLGNENQVTPRSLFYANLTACITLSVGFIITGFIKPHLRRHLSTVEFSQVSSVSDAKSYDDEKHVSVRLTASPTGLTSVSDEA